MTKTASILLVLLLMATAATASTLTPCTGSWDGPGQTACERLGAPGEVGTAGAIDWSRYTLALAPLFEITAYDASNTLRIDQMGQLVYERQAGGKVFASLLHPRQFALWRTFRGYIVGVEDLEDEDPIGSDYDHNDYVIEAVRTPVKYIDTRTGDVFEIDYANAMTSTTGGLQPTCRYNGRAVEVVDMERILSAAFGVWPWSNPNPPGLFAAAMEERILSLEQEVRNLKGYGSDPSQGPAYVSALQVQGIIEQYQRWATTGRFHADV